MLQIKLDTFKSEVLDSTVPVLIDFSATWCGPCKMMGPVLEELSTEYNGKAKVLKIDFDEAMPLAEQYGIMSVPTMMFFKGGKEVERVVGVTPPAILKEKLNKLF